MNQTRKLVLLEFKAGNTSPSQLNLLEYLIYESKPTKGAACLPFLIEEDNSCLLLIKASKDNEIPRQAFNKGVLFRQIQQGGHHKYLEINLTKIEARLREFCADGRVIGLNTLAQDELGVIRSKVDQIQKFDRETKDKDNWEQIFQDYIKEVEATNVTPAAYFKERSLNCMKTKSVMYHRYAKFEEFYGIKQKVYGDGAEYWSMQESLDNFIESNPCEKSGAECLGIVDAALHSEAVRAVVDSFFLRKDTKKHAIWLNGRTSSGKSEFISCYSQIFCCQRGDFQRGHLVVQPRTQENVKTQTVISPEFSVDVALDRDNLPSVLQLLEGKGGTVKANLYERYELKFEGVFFLIASNKLPEWAFFKTQAELRLGETNNSYENQWRPLATRIDIVTLTESFISQKFPYDATILAQAISELLKQIESKSNSAQSEIEVDEQIQNVDEQIEQQEQIVNEKSDEELEQQEAEESSQSDIINTNNDKIIEEGIASGEFDHGRERFKANKKPHYTAIYGYNVSQQQKRQVKAEEKDFARLVFSTAQAQKPLVLEGNKLIVSDSEEEGKAQPKSKKVKN